MTLKTCGAISPWTRFRQYNHSWVPSLVVRSFKPVPKRAVDVQVAKPISTEQNRVRFMHMPDKGGEKRLIGIGKQLIQLEAARNQRCQRNWSETLRHIGSRNAGIGKYIREIFFPYNPGPAYLVTNAMMDAPVKMVDEPPITALVDTYRVKSPKRPNPRTREMPPAKRSLRQYRSSGYRSRLQTALGVSEEISCSRKIPEVPG